MSKEKEMPGFVWLHEWSDNADNFDDAQMASFCRAMFAAARGKKYTLPEDPLALLAFKYANRDRERMDAFKKKQTKNGEGGGAPLGNKNALKQPKNNPKTTEEQPKNNPKQPQRQRQGQRQGQPQEQSQGQKQIQNNQDEDDNARGMSSVVVGLIDFLSNWWDVNLTPAQVALIDSKPADYWESFKDEIEASKWLKQQDLGKVFALHRNVVDGQYRTFKDTTPQPVPTYTPPKEPEFTPREQAIIDDFNAWRNDNPDLRGVYEYLKQLAEKHGGIPDKVCRALGMIYYANSWHFK